MLIERGRAKRNRCPELTMRKGVPHGLARPRSMSIVILVVLGSTCEDDDSVRIGSAITAGILRRSDRLGLLVEPAPSTPPQAPSCLGPSGEIPRIAKPQRNCWGFVLSTSAIDASKARIASLDRSSPCLAMYPAVRPLARWPMSAPITSSRTPSSAIQFAKVCLAQCDAMGLSIPAD